MSDINSIMVTAGSALNIISTISEIAKNDKIKAKTIELTSCITDIQSKLLTVQKESLEIFEENKKLKQKIDDFDKWEEIKKYYTLMKLGKSHLYQSNELNPIKDSKIFICPNCFTDRIESILQYLNAGKFNCPKCKNTFYSH